MNRFLNTKTKPSAEAAKPLVGMTSSHISDLLILSSLASCVLLLFRVFLTGNFFYFFLPWNLFLAWIPYLVSFCFLKMRIAGINRVKVLFLFILWLLFLPNSPYLLTDLVHLAPREGVPVWFDALIIVLFAWTGLLLGLISMLNVDRYLRDNFSRTLSRAISLFILVSCSFGVYVGRILRWNSWDMVVRPLALLKSISAQILHPFHHPQTWGMTLSFSLFLGLTYSTIRVFANPKGNGSEIW
jgi:uncharacterized membrane protein